MKIFRKNKNILKFFLVILLGLILLLQNSKSNALPIGFGRNMGGLDYIESKNPHFIVYADSRTPLEAKFTLFHLSQSKEFLESWFDVQRKRPLPVILSAETFNASFANFITDVLEIQTFGQASRDLVFHEYVHSTSYRHLDNWLGPAGSVLHLPWLPSWWLEGVAEALSVSVGSSVQAAFEMNAARTDSWPSYARLHSLYQKESFALEGYAISGAFSSYLLRKMKDPKDLARIHQLFFHKSLPWQWPYSIVPGIDSLPMDRSLKEMFGKNGEQLYEEYKNAAKIFWSQHSKSLNRANTLPSTIQEDLLNKPKSIEFSIQSQKQNDLFLKFEIHAQQKENKKIIYQNRNFLSNLRLFGKDLIWIEQNSVENKNQERLCRIHFEGASSLWESDQLEDFTGKTQDIKCSPFLNMQNLRILQSSSSLVAKEIYFLANLELEFENLYSLYRLNLENMSFEIVLQNPTSSYQQMIALHHAKEFAFVALKEDRFQKRIQFLNSNFKCVKELDAEEFFQRIHIGDDSHKHLHIQIRNGMDLENLKYDLDALPTRKCSLESTQTSPLLEAIRYKKLQKKTISLQEAMLLASSWHETKPEPDRSLESFPLSSVTPIDPKITSTYDDYAQVRPANWRGRAVAAVPWIGNDNSGLNYGVLSLPIMDHLQNESLRLSMLYGVESRFPSTDLLLESTRFYPTLSLSVSRSQIWNGVFKNRNLYYDENSVTAAASFELPKILSVSKIHAKKAFLKPLVGPTNIAKGHYTEFGLQHFITKNFWQNKWTLALNISGKTVPDFSSEDFEYNQIAITSYVKRSQLWKESLLLFQVDTSRTRGSKRRFLQEVYRPLKIFIPGDGGGINDLNFPVYGSGALFSGIYGDTLAKSSLTWSLPLVKDFDYLFKIFYFDRLDWNQFLSFGSAWRGDRPKLSQEDFVFAHGYNLDLQIDVKGLRFNSGIGTGQVIGYGWDMYFTFGFDAIF